MNALQHIYINAYINNSQQYHQVLHLSITLGLNVIENGLNIYHSVLIDEIMY